MNLSVIIPWGGAVDDPWRTGAFWWLRRRYRALLPEATVVVGTSDRDPFNRSEARNNAARLTTDSDVLLIADADTIFHSGPIRAGITAIEQGAPWVIPYGLGRYYNLSQRATVTIVKDTAPDATIPEPVDPDDWEHKLDSTAGLLLVPRRAWDAVGGYDEAFLSWGYEDDAFRVALDRIVGRHVRVDGTALHLWHQHSEAENFGQPHIEHNRARFHEYEMGIRP